MQIRPSKKIVPVIIACLLAVGAVVFAVEYPEIKSKKNQMGGVLDEKSKKIAGGELIATQKPVNVEIFKQISELDKNNDGVKDWEETLDKIVTIEEDLSETEKFSREIFAKYIDGKKTGDTNQQSIINELINKEISAENNKKFGMKDINISTDNKNSFTVEIKNYGNTIGFILASNPANNNDSELEILGRALAANDSEELKKIDPIISGYQKIISGIKSVSVPEEMATIHLDLLNNLQATLDNIEGLRKTFDDPIPGLLSLGQYFINTESLKQTLQKLVLSFENSGVVFAQSEYGYVLVRTI